MRQKLSHLREQTATYLQNAGSAENGFEAARLVLIAARCQEEIIDLERSLVGTAP